MLTEIQIPSYVPTTLFGLLGLLFVYIFLYFKNKDNNKLARIKSIKLSERSKVVQMELNELGVSFDTSNLTNEQKFSLLKEMLVSKNRKFLILAISAILIALIIAFLIFSNGKASLNNSNTGPSIVLDTSQKNTKIDTVDTNKREGSTPEKGSSKPEDVATGAVLKPPVNKTPEIAPPENTPGLTNGFTKMSGDYSLLFVEKSSGGNLELNADKGNLAVQVENNTISFEGFGRFDIYKYTSTNVSLPKFHRLEVEIPKATLQLKDYKNHMEFPVKGRLKIWTDDHNFIDIKIEKLIYDTDAEHCYFQSLDNNSYRIYVAFTKKL